MASAEWERGYGFGRLAAADVSSRHGMILAENNLRDLKRAPKRSDFDKGYVIGYEEMLRGKPARKRKHPYTQTRANMTKKRSRAKAGVSNPKGTRRTHKDVEFAVDDASGHERIFKTFDEAAGFAVNLAISDGREHNLDALTSSRAGARFLFGDAGEEMYDEDPEASVFARVVIKAEHIGRVS